MTVVAEALTGTIYDGGAVEQFAYMPTELDFARMGRVIAEAEQAARAGDSPIAAMLVRPDGTELLEQTYEFRNNSLLDHAEIRLLGGVTPEFGRNLGGCMMYCVAEPCGGCAYFLDKSQIGTLFVAAHRSDGDFFRPRSITMNGIFGESPRTLRVISGLRRVEALELLRPENRLHWDNGKRELM
jgi:tRNA(Arg) A34 adenosine deaminase TadA